VRKVLWWVIRLTPIGTVGLFGNAVAQYGWTTLGQLGAFTGAIYIGLALVLLVVYPTILALNGQNPVKFFRAPGRRSSWASSRARRSAPCR
jgi:Na+/H+-dicarboxylate symporter